jgi:hypothetical protein
MSKVEYKHTATAHVLVQWLANFEETRYYSKLQHIGTEVALILAQTCTWYMFGQKIGQLQLCIHCQIVCQQTIIVPHLVLMLFLLQAVK